MTWKMVCGELGQAKTSLQSLLSRFLWKAIRLLPKQVDSPSTTRRKTLHNPSASMGPNPTAQRMTVASTDVDGNWMWACRCLETGGMGSPFLLQVTCARWHRAGNQTRKRCTPATSLLLLSCFSNHFQPYQEQMSWKRNTWDSRCLLIFCTINTVAVNTCWSQPKAGLPFHLSRAFLKPREKLVPLQTAVNH